MLHQEVPFRAKREGRNRGIRTEESLIVAVVGDAICAGSVVVHQTEIELAARSSLCGKPELVQALGNPSRRVSGVGILLDWLSRLCVNDFAVGAEA